MVAAQWRRVMTYFDVGIAIDHSDMDTKVDDSFCEELGVLKRSVNSSDYQMSDSGDSGVIDEEAAKECENNLLQDFMDKNYTS
nr:kinesin-like protein KIN-4A [Tanacetum cinerariifolium]